MSTKLLLGCSLLLLAGCAPNALGPLVVVGQELHASLVTRKLEDAARLRLATMLRDNPYLSSDAEFVDAIAEIASQGWLGGGEGIRAALHALYLGESEVGLYGLEYCLYFKRLADLDKTMLEQLVVNSIAEVKRRHGNG